MPAGRRVLSVVTLHTRRMGMNAPRDPQRAPQPEIFWRRRVIALAVGLAIIGLLAWAVSGVVGGGGAARQAADVGHANNGGASAPATPTVAPSRAGASAKPAASARTHAPAPTRSPRPVRTAVTTVQTGDSCPAGDVVISLMAAGYSYGPQVLPEFEIAIVSTAAQTCAFDVGAKNVQLVIKSGPARVWGSADCVAGAGSRITQLARGVPTVLRISWDRKTSVPGCPASPRRGGPWHLHGDRLQRQAQQQHTGLRAPWPRARGALIASGGVAGCLPVGTNDTKSAPGPS